MLDRIVEQRRQQLNEEMKRISIEGWKHKIKGPGLHKPQDFFSAIKRHGQISIIAEVKKASPSRGVIREEFNPVAIAREYCEANVQAISVLTEKNFFMGGDEYLVRIRQAFPVPILRKDFIIDIWQIYQSRCLGADAILLIASVLTDEQLRKFLAVSGILGLYCIVEVHCEEELEAALAAGARIIGINNRNLRSFEVDLSMTEKLIGRIPHDRAVVSESGIRTAGDLKYLGGLGVDAVLIGEAFMRTDSIKDKVNELKAG
jgi:indole-3-glycerol phosphate synthase